MPLLQSFGNTGAHSYEVGPSATQELPSGTLKNGLIQWHDAADLSTFVYGNSFTVTLSRWINKANPGTLDFQQSTSSAQPALIQTGINNQPSVYFDGVQTYLDSVAGTTLTTAFTVMVVAKRAPNSVSVASSTYGRFISTASGTANDYDNVSSVMMCDIGPVNEGVGTWHNSVTRGSVIDAESTFSAMMRHDNALGYGNFQLHGSPIATDASCVSNAGVNRSVTMTALTGSWYLGAHHSGGTPGEYWNGYISEVLIWNRYLQDSEIAQLNNYLYYKWYVPPVITFPNQNTFSLNSYSGSAYSYQIPYLDLGGAAPTFAITAGSLPPGISMSSTGLLTGTSSSTSPYTITVSITDSYGHVSSKTMTLTYGLYNFPVNGSFTFTNAGVAGQNGPTLAQIQSAYSATSWTQSTANLNMTQQGYQLWTVPVTGTYAIDAYGAAGGSGKSSYGGGLGARIYGQFSLTVGQVLKILVGHVGPTSNHSQGSSYGLGCGGGGTFVTKSDNTILVIAGGGSGGVNDAWTGNVGGNNASTGNNGNNNPQNNAYAGGSNGNGGNGPYAAPGAGYSGNAPTPSGNSGNDNSLSFLNGGTGGRQSLSWGDQGGYGGFGGGGGAGGLATGGGGGYSGGASGQWSSYEVGGGGGSYNNGANQINTAGANGGNGYVTITRIS